MEACADDKLRIIIYHSVVSTENAHAPFLHTLLHVYAHTAQFPVTALTWQGSIEM